MKKKKGQWTEMCINSIMTKSRIHYIGRKSDSDNGLGKSKKKRSKKVSSSNLISLQHEKLVASYPAFFPDF